MMMIEVIHYINKINFREYSSLLWSSSFHTQILLRNILHPKPNKLFVISNPNSTFVLSIFRHRQTDTSQLHAHVHKNTYLHSK